MDDIIDEVMEYEPESLVPNIDDHIFTNNEGVNKDGGEGEEQELAVNVGGQMVQPCLMDLVKVGRNKLKEMNVKKLGWSPRNARARRGQLQNTSWIE